MPEVDPFANLPEISFCQVDIAALTKQAIQGFQNNWYALTGEKLSLSLADRRANFIYSMVYYLVQERLLIDASAKQNLLPYSTGGFLDALAMFYDTYRLAASPAITQIEFTLDQVYAVTQTIPKGTTVESPSTGMLFTTDDDLLIASGYLTGSIDSTCTTAGPAGNGLLDVNSVVNWSQTGFLVTAQNMTATIGGADTESDAAFRIRLLGATDSYSPAGPKGRYRYYALGVSPDISDVSVLGPEDGLAPGNVQVVVLLQNGQFPDALLLQDVYNALNTDTVRDLCAQLTVTAPSGVAYTVNVRYWIDKSDSTNVVHIGENVTAAVTAWTTDISSGIGGSVNPASLSKAILDAGASYCVVDSPPRIQLSLTQVGVLTDDPVVNYEGLESDLQPVPI